MSIDIRSITDRWVNGIRPSGNYPKVLSSIIQRVAVDVVDYLTTLGADYFPVQVDRLSVDLLHGIPIIRTVAVTQSLDAVPVEGDASIDLHVGDIHTGKSYRSEERNGGGG